MAWSWSYSNEGLDLIQFAIGEQDRTDLETAFAEHRAFAAKGRSNVKFDFNHSEYRRSLKLAETLAEDTLAAEVYRLAEEFSTCSNGAHGAWYCPYGCHEIELNAYEGRYQKMRAEDE
jgi:hypothetical protein